MFIITYSYEFLFRIARKNNIHSQKKKKKRCANLIELRTAVPDDLTGPFQF